MNTPSTYAVILAGGSGRRFWPLSRDTRPKQLLELFGGKTLLEHAMKRLEGLVPRENILILTNREQEEAARDANAVMLVLPADQLIQDEAAFRTCMAAAVTVAHQTQALVTIGISPTWACPSYGYIERGPRTQVAGAEDAAIYEVQRFREKPNPDLAEDFLRQGNFSWNAGMFIWSVSAVVAELSRHRPELAHFVAEIRHSKDLKATIEAQFAALPQISIVYALMEKAGRVLNVEASFDWDDVGSWISVGKYLPKDAAGNAANQALVQIDSHDNIVFSTAGQNISLLGVTDLIVVQTADALLVANRHSADAIKKIVELVPTALH